jgi:hypothetical protein
MQPSCGLRLNSCLGRCSRTKVYGRVLILADAAILRSVANSHAKPCGEVSRNPTPGVPGGTSLGGAILGSRPSHLGATILVIAAGNLGGVEVVLSPMTMSYFLSLLWFIHDTSPWSCRGASILDGVPRQIPQMVVRMPGICQLAFARAPQPFP